MNIAHKYPRFFSLFLVFSLVLGHTPVSAAPTAPWVTASAAVVMEASTGNILYNKNADTMMVPASMTKVMTAYIIFEEIYAGNMTLETQVPVSSYHAELSRNSALPQRTPMTAGSTLSVDLLLKLILIPSSSSACVVMADFISGSESAFVQRMNQTAERLSVDAKYSNCHGAYVHYITARGQARLIQVFMQQFPQILDYTSMTTVTFNGSTYSNTNYLIRNTSYYYPDCDGFKTGTISASGYCVSATAERNGNRIITVVLNSSSNDGRYGDSVKLLDYGFDVLAESPPTFLDPWAHGPSTQAYERFRLKGVQLQPINGWIRPGDVMTQGEFAVTLVSALEKYGVVQKPSTKPGNQPWVEDLQDYYEGDVILRGIAYGLIPYGGGNFSPDAPLTQSYLDDTLAHCASTLRIILPQVQPEVDNTVNEAISYEAIQTATFLLMGLPFPEVSLAACVGKNQRVLVPVEPEYDGTQLLRGEGILAVESLLNLL